MELLCLHRQEMDQWCYSTWSSFKERDSPNTRKAQRPARLLHHSPEEEATTTSPNEGLAGSLFPTGPPNRARAPFRT
jgi:hypothetical protein